MLRSRKGSIFVLMLTALFIFAILPMLYFTVHVKSSKFERDIGEKQRALLDTYEKGEIPLFYIDQSAKQSYYTAVSELMQSGGLKEEGCGEFDGYALLNNEQEECYPDLKTSIKKSFDAKFNAKLGSFPEKIPELGYDYFLTTDDEQVSFVGKAKKSLRMDISEKGYNFIAEEEKFVSSPIPPELAPPILENPDDPVTNPPIENPENPPIDDGSIISQPDGKCGYLIGYADTFIGCPYLLNCGYANYIACQYFPPDDCRVGLTCATFVGSVITQELGFDNFAGHGATKCSSNVDKVRMLGTNVDILQPGDVFQAGNNIGHTGMYAGRGTLVGEISYFGIRTCYERFLPSSSGRHVFIHSIGNSDGGPPGVCYEYYEDLFAEGRNQVTQYCRLNACE